jgi:hypothetical protein
VTANHLLDQEPGVAQKGAAPDDDYVIPAPSIEGPAGVHTHGTNTPPKGQQTRTRLLDPRRGVVSERGYAGTLMITSAP